MGNTLTYNSGPTVDENSDITFTRKEWEWIRDSNRDIDESNIHKNNHLNNNNKSPNIIEFPSDSNYSHNLPLLKDIQQRHNILSDLRKQNKDLIEQFYDLKKSDMTENGITQKTVDLCLKGTDIMTLIKEQRKEIEQLENDVHLISS